MARAFRPVDRTTIRRPSATPCCCAASPGASAEQIEDLVEIALSECERFYPAFQLVVWGGKNAGRGDRGGDDRPGRRGVRRIGAEWPPKRTRPKRTRPPRPRACPRRLRQDGQRRCCAAGSRRARRRALRSSSPRDSRPDLPARPACRGILRRPSCRARRAGRRGLCGQAADRRLIYPTIAAGRRRPRCFCRLSPARRLPA